MSLLRASLLSSLLLLTACGFHLRGMLDFPAAMNQTYIEYSGNDIEVRQQVARQLAANGVSIASSPESATAILQIPSSTVSRKVLSKNVEGRPQEYRVQVEIFFQVLDGEGNTISPRDSVTRETVLALDPNDPLGARVAVEESARTLREDAVREMLQRISASASDHEAVSR